MSALQIFCLGCRSLSSISPSRASALRRCSVRFRGPCNPNSIRKIRGRYPCPRGAFGTRFKRVLGDAERASRVQGQAPGGSIPVRKLPNEILAEVFFHCGDPRSGDLENWAMSQVCWRWRTVALSTPRRWTNIAIHPWSRIYTSDRRLLLLLSLQIERSGPLPLILRYEGHMQFPRDTRRSILDLFLSAAHRWQDVSLDMTYANFQRLSDFTGGFPSLTRLAILNGENLGIPIGSVFSNCPRLHCVQLLSFPRLDMLELPWAQLNTCTLEVSAHDVSRILQKTPGIETIFLRRGRQLTDVAMLTPSCSLQSLKSLSMISYDDSETILAILTAPALRRLIIVGNSGRTTPLVGFLDRSRCFLTHLALSYTLTDADAVLMVLGSLPELTHLAIREADADVSYVVDALSQAPPLVPRLASVILSGYFSCANAVLVETLRVRLRFGSLRAVRLIAVYESSPVIHLSTSCSVTVWMWHTLRTAREPRQWSSGMNSHSLGLERNGW
ncbi:hypothetical protein B0H15DRAFT_446969 [Mycena belliarum]|uniref:F-box domain-containing protein n=1 Tax=Mycena belliarum TaxID=1033014 RepID=A0AAD6TW73_9AGAR|nr:hypothetical protein B0H15DRAFT_446969 [Mycena belliae]